MHNHGRAAKVVAGLLEPQTNLTSSYRHFWLRVQIGLFCISLNICTAFTVMNGLFCTAKYTCRWEVRMQLRRMKQLGTLQPIHSLITV